jgi:hypothetical protein
MKNAYLEDLLETHIMYFLFCNIGCYTNTWIVSMRSGAPGIHIKLSIAQRVATPAVTDRPELHSA